jgi:hypothetical protein
MSAGGYNLIPPPGADVSKWFTNIPSGTTFTPGKISLDYSMQLAFGLANFRTAHAISAEKNAIRRKLLLNQALIEASTPANGEKQ